MERVRHVARLAGVDVVDIGSATLFPSTAAVCVIDFCEENNICILGMDGFRLRGPARIPDMGVIADFSGASAVESIRLARTFVNETMQPELWYEFVFEGVD